MKWSSNPSKNGDTDIGLQFFEKDSRCFLYVCTCIFFIGNSVSEFRPDLRSPKSQDFLEIPGGVKWEHWEEKVFCQILNSTCSS